MVNLRKLLYKILDWIRQPEVHEYDDSVEACFTATNLNTNTTTRLSVANTPGNAGIYHGIWSDSANNWMVYGGNEYIYTQGGYPMITFWTGNTGEWFTQNTTNVKTLDSANIARWGHVVQLYLKWTNKSAISVVATGNITNVTLGTIAEKYWPLVPTVLYGSGNTPYGTCVYTLNTDGTLTLTDLESRGATYSIAAGTSFYLRGIYIR